MKRLFSYCIDYIWFSLFLASALLKFNFSLVPCLCLLLFTPLLFVPIEAFFLKVTRSSIGKSIFSLYAFEDKSISWKRALQASFKQGLLHQFLFIPFLTSSMRKKYKSFCIPLLPKKRTMHERLISFSTVAMMFFYLCFSKNMIVQKSYRHIKTHHIDHITHKDESNWVEVKVKDPKFSIYFPDKIKKDTSEIKVKGTTRTLFLHTYKNASSPIIYTLTHTKLPNAWVKWSHKLALSGALDGIIKEEKCTVLKKKNISIQGKAGIEYVLKSKDQLKKGRLILDKQTLFRVQGEYASDYPVQDKDDLLIKKFLNLFDLHS